MPEPASPAVVVVVVVLTVLVLPAVAATELVALAPPREERFEDDRWRREGVGCTLLVRKTEPSVACAALSATPVEADVDDVLEVVEALFCCRSSVSSRVRRFTTASCSFSSCMWRSAAVRGLGWRRGPGPGSTPVLSSRGGGALNVVTELGERGGEVEEKMLLVVVDGEPIRSDRRREFEGRRGVAVVR